MLVKTLFLAFILSATGLTDDLDNDDVPQQCRSVCAPVVSLTRTCDNQFDDDDSSYQNCVCNAQGASSQIPLCEACVASNDRRGHDNDVGEILRACGFTTASANPSVTSSPQTISVPQPRSSDDSGPRTHTDDDSGHHTRSDDDSGHHTRSSDDSGPRTRSSDDSGFQSFTTNATQSTGSVVPPAFTSPLTSLTIAAASNTASSGTSTGSVAAQSTNDAPMPTAGMMGMGLGALGIVLGML